MVCFKNMAQKMQIFKNPKFVIFIAVIIVLGLLFTNISSSKSQNSASETKMSVSDVRSTQDLYKDFEYPIKNAKGVEIGKTKFSFTTAEFRDQLIIKGKKTSSTKGRTFLVLNIKISNSMDNSIQVNSRDYVRLSVNGNEAEWLAPDVHNDPVEIQAISTKQTRLAFLVNESDTKFVLQIGEIKGTKEKVELTISL